MQRKENRWNEFGFVMFTHSDCNCKLLTSFEIDEYCRFIERSPFLISNYLWIIRRVQLTISFFIDIISAITFVLIRFQTFSFLLNVPFTCNIICQWFPSKFLSSKQHTHSNGFECLLNPYDLILQNDWCQIPLFSLLNHSS